MKRIFTVELCDARNWHGGKVYQCIAPNAKTAIDIAIKRYRHTTSWRGNPIIQKLEYLGPAV